LGTVHEQDIILDITSAMNDLKQPFQLRVDSFGVGFGGLLLPLHGEEFM
jgi:hypothetical protein